MDASARGSTSYTLPRKAAIYERALSMLASSRQAQIEDVQLGASARSDSYENKQEALEELHRMAEESPGCDRFGADWGRPNARRHSSQWEGNKEASAYDKDQLMMAATLATAEFRAPRRFDATLVENYSLKVRQQLTPKLRGGGAGVGWAKLALWLEREHATKLNLTANGHS